MSVVNAPKLLEDVAPGSPCGENLEYDSAFGEMERASQGKPEQQFGGTIVPAEEPNWRELRSKALDLAARTKDLRVSAHLARSALATDGLTGFRDALTVIRGYVERFWECVHPQLDPDDDNDPTFRVNTIVSLCHAPTLRLLRETPLVSVRGVGSFSQRDLMIVAGELPPRPNVPAPEVAAIEAAFSQVDIAELQANAAAVDEAIGNVQAIEAAVTEKVGTGNAASLAPLVDALRSLQKNYAPQLSRRGAVATPGAVADAGAASGQAASSNGAAAPQPQRLSGEITSREDVILVLDKVCDYYNRFEPSSPLPLLIRRAKRLATKSFLEILRDLVPDAISQAESLGGPPPEE